MARFGVLDIPDKEASRLSDAALIARLVQSGISRLTAHRIVELERAKAAPGRARAHAQSRR